MQTKTISVQTKKFFDIIDLTKDVEKFLNKITAQDGLINIFTRHTTVAIKINEKETGFFQDLKEILFKEIANTNREYLHNNTHIRDPKTICPLSKGNDCLNGHSHIAQMFLGSASETIPVKNGEMLLGTWQKVLMFELDNKREREVVLSFVGK